LAEVPAETGRYDEAVIAAARPAGEPVGDSDD
jgi:hypothetical protein